MSAGEQSAAGGSHSEPAGEVPDELRKELQELGLSPYEARLLLGMLKLGPANTYQLAQASNVPRTSTYPVLKGLSSKGLAYRLHSEGPAVWACVSRDEILEQLEQAEHERLRQFQERSERVRAMLAEFVPEDEAAEVEPAVRLLYHAAQRREVYQRLARQTHTEALFFVRAIDPGEPEGLDPVIAELAGRGVETRVLFAAGAERESSASPSIAAMHACREAGGYARAVDELPMDLAVFDRQAALVTLDAPAADEAALSTVALIEHPGFCEVLAEGFKHRWVGGAGCPCHDH